MTEEERQRYMAEHNWVESCDDDEREEEFAQELTRLNSNYNLGSNTWHVTVIEGFKQAVEKEFGNFYKECKLTWDFERTIDGKPCLKLTVNVTDLGLISTEITMEYLSSLPKELPSQLAQVFERKFNQKQERLLKEWSNGKKKK